MKNSKKFITLFLLIAMTVSCLIPLTSCVTDDPPVTTPCTEHTDADKNGKCDNCDATVEVTPGKGVYTVIVKSIGGLTFADVNCYIYDGDKIVAKKKTNENGIANFELDQKDGYKVEIEAADLPDGYKIGDFYDFVGSSAVVTIGSAPISDGTAPTKYEAGDIIYDYEFTTIDGVKIKISDILKEKKMVLLNFWYTGCRPCETEFPHMASAYEKYGEDVEIITINNYPTETAEDVKNYTYLDKNSGEYEPLPFLNVKDDTINISAQFGSYLTENGMSVGWPTSVVIDRYGMISIIESGAIVNEKYFTNLFKTFTDEKYTQKTYVAIEELSPIEKPDENLNMPSSDEVASVLDPNGKLNVTFSEETNPADAEYAWPFLIGKKGEYDCIYPSNNDRDNSFAIIYMNVEIKDGEALVFDYLSSSQLGQDLLYVIVDGKDIYSISGVGENWQSCCAYVSTETRVYEVALCYRKDLADFDGDDAVYIKNLRMEDPNTLDIEAHIFRYAATEPNEENSGFNKYADIVYNANDGYYHVGTVDGPILFANLLGYTRFDESGTVFERFYSDYDAPTEKTTSFLVNGVEKYHQFVMYGSLGSNSDMYGYVPVTEELKECLIKFTEDAYLWLGKEYDENMWLQLCCYYDAYGKDAKQLEDPVKGLSTFSAYEATLGKDNTVTYDKIIVPRGLFYKFTPTVSGMYRVTSNSDKSVIGWIYKGESSEWAANGEYGYREIYVDAETNERYNTALIKYDEEGNAYVDTTNISMTSYMEAGKDYYIVIAYHTVENLGTFTFEVEKINDNLIPFIEAASGPYSYDLETGQINAGTSCIDVIYDETEDRYYQLMADGTRGAMIYADFMYPTNVITNVSLSEMLDIKDAFVFGKTEKELAALQLLKEYGRKGFAEYLGVDLLDEKFTEEYNKATKVENEDGDLVDRPEAEINAFLARYAEEGLRTLWGSDFDKKWAEYGMDDVIAANYHSVDYTSIFAKYAAMVENDIVNAPERQGTVAVTKELAEALQAVIDNYGFFGVDRGWLKFCFYYNFDLADPAMKDQLN